MIKIPFRFYCKQHIVSKLSKYNYIMLGSQIYFEFITQIDCDLYIFEVTVMAKQI